MEDWGTTGWGKKEDIATTEHGTINDRVTVLFLFFLFNAFERLSFHIHSGRLCTSTENITKNGRSEEQSVDYASTKRPIKVRLYVVKAFMV